MLDTQSTTFFLNLEEAYVIDSTDTTLTLELPRKKHPCPVCGQRTDKIHDYRLQKVKHIPLLHKSYELFLRKRRYYCPHCTKRFAETVPFLGKFQRMSHLLKQFVISQFSSMKSATEIARQAHIFVTTVLRLFDHVSYPKPLLPEVLAIDEFKGNAAKEKFQCILANPKTKTTLDILKNRKSEDLYKYFTAFSLEQRQNVLWPA